MGGDEGQGFRELGSDKRRRRGEHQRKQEGLDLVLLRLRDHGTVGIGRGPAGANEVLEVNRGGQADLLVDGGTGNEAEESDGEARMIGGGGKGRLRGTSGLGGWRQALEEPLGEGFQGRRVVEIHGRSSRIVDGGRRD